MSNFRENVVLAANKKQKHHSIYISMKNYAQKQIGHEYTSNPSSP